MDRPATAEAKVEAVWFQSQLAKQVAAGGDDADVGAGDEEMYLAISVNGADSNVAEAAQVAEGDAAVGIDAVLADAIVGGPVEGLRPGLELGVEDRQWRLTAESAVWATLVVVLPEGVELGLENGQRAGGSLPGEKQLEGLVEALDLAAGLGVVRGGVLDRDAQALELQLEGRPCRGGSGR